MRFDKKDERRHFALSSPNPLVNFALNCCTTSSPVLDIYPSGSLNFLLEKAAQRYLSRHIHVEKLESKGSTLVVKVPKMLGMYYSDFGKNKKEMLQFFVPFLPLDMENGEELRIWLKEEKGKVKVKIEEEEIDWRYLCDLTQISQGGKGAQTPSPTTNFFSN
mmetsp:Transcript_6133/g.9292  ORF Transcript_6133/g.9292 Transcript_6133/m.9292 type:complete len:162 (+) Transcript_6133:598-1083(+)